MKLVLTMLMLAIYVCVFSLTGVDSYAEENQNISLSVIIDYSRGNVSFGDIQLVSGEHRNKDAIGDYNLRVYSFKENILYSTNFNFSFQSMNMPPREWFDDKGNQIFIPNVSESLVGNPKISSTEIP